MKKRLTETELTARCEQWRVRNPLMMERIGRAVRQQIARTAPAEVLRIASLDDGQLGERVMRAGGSMAQCMADITNVNLGRVPAHLREHYE